MKLAGVFFLFKTYSESGFGFNFYIGGWRIIGLDYHAWQVRQDPKTGKPLKPEEQYWGPAIPHIDIPYWNLHHWPWQQFDDHEALEEKKKEADARRSEKFKRKMEKQEKRAEQVRQRQSKAEGGGEPEQSKTQQSDDQIDMNALFG